MAARHWDQPVRQAIPPRNGLPNWQLLSQIAGRIGSRFRMKYKSPAEITTDKNRRVVPLYAGLNLDGGLDEAVRDLGKFPLVPVAPSAAALGAGTASPPRATLAFDHLERRFEQRWQALFERARRAIEAAT